MTKKYITIQYLLLKPGVVAAYTHSATMGPSLVHLFNLITRGVQPVPFLFVDLFLTPTTAKIAK